MSQLSGRPRLAGIVRRLASTQGPIQDSWEDKSTYLDGRVKKLRKGRAQLWPSWSLTIVATDAEWLVWRSDLRGDGDGVFDWCPRTRRPGDPEWLEEHTFRARVQGGLPTLSPLRQRNAAGVYVYIVDVVIEGVEPYAAEPDSVLGGYRRLNAATADADGFHDIEPTGDATLVETAYPVSIIDPATGGVVQGTRYYADLGPVRTAALRTERQADGSLIIHTADQ